MFGCQHDFRMFTQPFFENWDHEYETKEPMQCHYNCFEDTPPASEVLLDITMAPSFSAKGEIPSQTIGVVFDEREPTDISLTREPTDYGTDPWSLLTMKQEFLQLSVDKGIARILDQQRSLEARLLDRLSFVDTSNGMNAQQSTIYSESERYRQSSPSSHVMRDRASEAGSPGQGVKVVFSGHERAAIDSIKAVFSDLRSKAYSVKSKNADFQKSASSGKMQQASLPLANGACAGRSPSSLGRGIKADEIQLREDEDLEFPNSALVTSMALPPKPSPLPELSLPGRDPSRLSRESPKLMTLPDCPEEHSPNGGGMSPQGSPHVSEGMEKKASLKNSRVTLNAAKHNPSLRESVDEEAQKILQEARKIKTSQVRQQERLKSLRGPTLKKSKFGEDDPLTVRIVRNKGFDSLCAMIIVINSGAALRSRVMRASRSIRARRRTPVSGTS